MSQTFGIEARHTAPQTDQDVPPARWLVLIDSAASGTRLARLFLDSRVQVAEFDAAGPEVQSLTRGLLARQGAWEPAWDAALAGHTAAERCAAQVYTLDV